MAEAENQEEQIAEGTPVLFREELITILEALFRLSKLPNNAFEIKDDGLYVKDLEDTLTGHIENDNIHPTKQQTDILKNFSLIDDILCSKGNIIASSLSAQEDNELELKPDGFYFKQREDNTEELKQFARDLIIETGLYDWQIVPELPENSISDSTIYLIEQQVEDLDISYYAKWIHKEDTWISLDILLETFNKLARREEVAEAVEKVHEHENKDALDLFTIDEETGRLLFNNIDILDTMQVSDDTNNAIRIGQDGKLFVPDLRSELDSVERGAFNKTVLLSEECNESGEYNLEDDINNYNFIIVEYYLKPEPTPPAAGQSPEEIVEEDLNPYDAKSDMIDVDNLNYLYNNHIDYMLEHDYGFSTYNTKIRLWDRKLQVTYYNKVCIYRIVGIK